MKTISAGLSTHLAQTTTNLATIWRLIRTDGTNFYFTDHDVDIPFDDGDGEQTYLAESGYTRTAIANNSSLAVDNMDVEGLLTNEGIEETELRSGLFDYAEVRISMINWSDLSQGVLKMRRGHLGEVILTPSGVFRTEMRGLTSQLSQQIVDSYQAECSVDLGSPPCGIPITPPLLGRNTAVTVDEVFRVPTLTEGSLVTITNGLVNPSFETDAPSLPIGAITGWTIVTGNWGIRTSWQGLTADDGSNFATSDTGAPGDGELTQTFDISGAGISDVSTDSGATIASFSIKVATMEFLRTNRVLVEFLTGADAFISNMFDTGVESISPRDIFTLRSVTDVTVPATCRKIKVSLFFDDGGITNSPASSFDNSILSITGYDGSIGFEGQFENRIYRVNTAGTTAGSQPTYDTVVGNPTTDGSAILEAEESWTRFGFISTVTSNFIFTASIEESRAVDDWFNGGTIQFNDGENNGFRVEVKDWVQSSGTITLYLGTPFTLVVGTTFGLYPGCDKSSQTCLDKFDNIINFRGYPFIPGQDALLNTPDAG